MTIRLPGVTALPPVSPETGAAGGLPSLPPAEALPSPTPEELAARLDDLEARVSSLETQPPSAARPLTPPGL